MLSGAAVIAASYAIGTVPVAYLAGRAAKGIDIRQYGSGNVGASNIWQTVSRTLVIPVGLAQVIQGAAGVLIARASGQPASVEGAAALAAVVANDWNPWLRFAGGRGIGVAIGAMLVLSPAVLAAFIGVSLAGVALRAAPQGTATGLALAPAIAAVTGEPAHIVAALAAIWVTIMVKRLLGNGRPDPAYPRPQVWLTRLVYDRDDPDREAWVRRNVEPAEPALRR
jgi:glycerol-3-phosphate acyltransferase PlsY